MRMVLAHALPNAVGPIANAVALSLSYLLGGVIIVETIFNYPGIAKLMVDGVTQRDMPLVQACAMLFCAGYLMLVTDRRPVRHRRQPAAAAPMKRSPRCQPHSTVGSVAPVRRSRWRARLAALRRGRLARPGACVAFWAARRARRPGAAVADAAQHGRRRRCSRRSAPRTGSAPTTSAATCWPRPRRRALHRRRRAASRRCSPAAPARCSALLAAASGRWIDAVAEPRARHADLDPEQDVRAAHGRRLRLVGADADR